MDLTGIVPRVKWLAVERERIGIQQALAAQQEQRRLLDANLDSITEHLKVTEAQYQGRWMTELSDTETKLDSITADSGEVDH